MLPAVRASGRVPRVGPFGNAPRAGSARRSAPRGRTTACAGVPGWAGVPEPVRTTTRDWAVPTELLASLASEQAAGGAPCPPNCTVYTVRLTTSWDRGSALSEPLAGVNVCLIGRSGAAVLHRISPVNDPADNRRVMEDICSIVGEDSGADCASLSSVDQPQLWPVDKDPGVKQRFQEGAVDEVSFVAPELGGLAAILVAPEGGAWTCDEVDVFSSRSKHMDRFVCRKQLGGRRGDAAAYLTPVPPNAVVYGTGDAARVITKEQAAALQALSLSDYGELKSRLLLTTALLTLGGSGVAALASGVHAALPFALGGVAGLLYQLLLQVGADAAVGGAASPGAAPAPAPAPGGAQGLPGRMMHVLGSSAVRLALLTSAALAAVWSLQDGTGARDGSEAAALVQLTPVDAWQMGLGLAGFMMYKVAVLGVSLAPPPPPRVPAPPQQRAPATRDRLRKRGTSCAALSELPVSSPLDQAEPSSPGHDRPQAPAKEFPALAPPHPPPAAMPGSDQGERTALDIRELEEEFETVTMEESLAELRRRTRICIKATPWVSTLSCVFVAVGLGVWYVFTKRALALTQDVMGGLFSQPLVLVDELAASVGWTTLLMVIAVSCLLGVTFFVSLLRTYQYAAAVPDTSCGAPGKVSYGAYAGLVAVLNAAWWLLTVVVALLLAASLVWLTLAFVFSSAIYMGVENRPAPAGRPNAEVYATARAALDGLATYAAAVQPALPAAVAAAPQVAAMNSAVSQFLATSREVPVTLCPVSCFNMGSFYDTLRLSSSCICSEADVNDLSDKATRNWECLVHVLASLALMGVGCLWQVMNMSANYAHARRDVRDARARAAGALFTHGGDAVAAVLATWPIDKRSSKTALRDLEGGHTTDTALFGASAGGASEAEAGGEHMTYNSAYEGYVAPAEAEAGAAAAGARRASSPRSGEAEQPSPSSGGRGATFNSTAQRYAAYRLRAAQAAAAKGSPSSDGGRKQWVR
ncbi:hypothetical protein HT031_005345 [Scenedesmus sp. PABB004]|nr:hypothetical protein HT031_005345 [Scenedesmus sp. PABB004]